MHSKNRESNKKWTRTLVTGGLALAAIVLAGTAQADHRGHRHSHGDHYRDGRHNHARDRAAVRDARRYDRRLDRRGDAIDFQLDLLAMIAAANGEYALAEHLDRKGDRIERRLDRRGDRALRAARLDRRDHRHGTARKHAHDRKLRRKLERERDRNHALKRKLDRKRDIDHRIARERDRDRDRKIARQRDRDRKRNRDHDDRIRERRLSHVEALGRHARDRRY